MATTVRIPVSILAPNASANAGNSFYTVVALTAHDYGHWEFVNAVQGNVFGQVHVPHNLAATPNAGIICSFAANAVAGVAVLTVASARVASGATLNPASLTAETAQNITVPATAYFRFDVTFSPLSVTPQADDVLLVEILHNGTNVNDTLAVHLLLLEAVLQCDLA